LELLDDEELEHEIEEADTFSGRVRRAIIDATRVISEKRMASGSDDTFSILQQFTKCLKNKTHCTKVSTTLDSLRFERFVLLALHTHTHTQTYTHKLTQRHIHKHTHTTYAHRMTHVHHTHTHTKRHIHTTHTSMAK